MKLLIVEDMIELLDLMKDLFIHQGHVVFTATNGLEALQILEIDKEIDAIISDHQMPVMNWIELKQWVFKKYCYQIPFILYTASIIDNEFEKDRDGIYAILPKSTGIKTLEKYLKEIEMSLKDN